MSDLRAALDKMPPGPYRYDGPHEQGGHATVWGKQGTPPDFKDGWAIPLVAYGVDTAMAALTDLLNAALASPATESEAQAGLGERCEKCGGEPRLTFIAAKTTNGKVFDPEYHKAVCKRCGFEWRMSVEQAPATPVAPEPRLDVERLALALMGSSVGTCHHHPAWTERAALAQARRLADEYANPVNPDDRDAIREYAEYRSQSEATEPERER